MARKPNTSFSQTRKPEKDTAIPARSADLSQARPADLSQARPADPSKSDMNATAPQKKESKPFFSNFPFQKKIPALQKTTPKGNEHGKDTPSSSQPEQKTPPLDNTPAPKQDISLTKETFENLLKKEDNPDDTLQDETIIESYEFKSKDIPLLIHIKKVKTEFVPIYDVKISSISKTTDFILEKIRQEIIRKVNLGLIDLSDIKKTEIIEDKFKQTIESLVGKYFPDVSDEIKGFLTSYLIAKALGLGVIELLMDDSLLEEIVINQASEPIWVYHKNHGWLKTTLKLQSEDQIRHYAAIIGRRVGRQISVLEPLLDAHMNEGDRANATLTPISTAGNTITLRKFSRDPWTITKFIKSKTINLEAASLIWMAMEFEMSAIIAGGTASGKTSALNVLANFFPPNQRIISIEDTREIRLPKYLHWVPLNTRLPNAEGKGEISMEHLLVNSLRMRPDRILVGEVRRRKEAETLFEAIHTGHSVYATFHANNAQEAVERLTNPPIDVPKIMLPAISLIIVQFRNRRTGTRRTFQIAEILPDATPHVLLQYDYKLDNLVWINKSKSLFDNLRLYTGYTDKEINQSLLEKQKILSYLIKNNIESVDAVGRVIAEYYTNKAHLLTLVNKGKKLEDTDAS